MRDRLYPFGVSASVETGATESDPSSETIELPPEADRIESIRVVSSESVITEGAAVRVREPTGEVLFPRESGFHPVAESVAFPAEFPVDGDDEIVTDFKNVTGADVVFGVALGVRLR